MLKNISRDVKPGPTWGKYFGTLVVSNIEPVTLQKYLGVMFTSPVTFTDTGLNPSLEHWVENSVSIGSAEVAPLTFKIGAKLEFRKPYTIDPKDTLTVYFNSPAGHLPSDPAKIVDSFILLADPVGTVNIHCEAAPNPALVACLQTVTFTAGSMVDFTSMKPGQTVPFPIFPGIYTVTADELANQNETVVATAVVKPVTITVGNGKSTSLDVSYTQVNKYSAIDVTIGNLSPSGKEQVHVKLVRSGKTLEEIWGPHHTLPFRRLLPSGTIDVSVDTTLNNLQYSCKPQSVSVSNELYKFNFPKADKVASIDTSGFVKLPINVTTDLPDLPPGEKITVRLIGISPAFLVYTQQVDVKVGTTPFVVPVAPDQYAVQVQNFIYEYTVYVVKASPTLTVKPDGHTTLSVKITRGAHLKVPGFPNFLGFGGISNLGLKDKETFINEPDFEQARASSVFKYAGEGGDGNPSDYLTSDAATVNAVKFAYNVGKKLGKPFIPVMVSYTCNLSGGEIGILTNPGPKTLAHTFGNLILSLTQANDTIRGLNNKVDAVGFVINPDFIAMCQQNKLTAKTPVRFAQDLQAALTFRKITAVIPDNIKGSETLGGYIHAVNWLLRTVASEFKFTVTFGWQVNLWGLQSAYWIYGKDDPAIHAKEIADYAKSLGVFDGPYCPDFLAVDRWEADDFTSRGYPRGYCFGPHEWPRFFKFCQVLSETLKIPVMPWQIPSSHTPLVKDLVVDLDKEHWGTGGSYMLGDPGINSHYRNVNPKILAIKFSIPEMGEGVTAMFKREKSFDWTDPVYADFPLYGIFAVLLGGGQTTGIASDIGNPGPWVRDKLHDYMNHPISLENLNPGLASNH